ncbi:MAG TPA: hypothetical protein DC049_08880, partial [Spirochaetia bacterium]|nr:hypothetical protein [Spirochaetia bacterium]
MNKTDSSVVSGFRLETLEILNWGTFNGNIYRITPGGATSLLTGANGSGKSTIVDALLTLLVPNLRRNYNLASGSEQKRERDEKSYVLGAFGRRRSESDNITRVEYLRNRNSYSVLLARFHDEANSHDVTLVQIFYFQNDSLMKFQVAAETALEIKNDFSGFTSIRELRKKLRERQGVEVFDNFSDYAGAFRRLLGLESEKALDLFNQTVSIKEIGNLNDFIRRHMLERPDVEGRIDTLRKNFDNLDAAHKAIIRAADQLEKLNPLVNLLDSYDAILAEIRQCVMLQSIIPVYFAEMKLDLVNRALSGIDEKLRSLQNQTASLDHELEKRQEEELNLRQSIEQNSDALRLKELLREKQNLEKELNNRREQSIRYNRLAGLVELITEPAEKTFYQNREKSAERLAGHTAVLEKLQIQRDENTIALSKLQSEEKVLTEEVESLLSRSSQIPASLHRERACAAAELGIDENMLPFAGEIIKVRDDCRELEGIIEFILRPFALSILVPAEHAAAFSRYINKKDLSRKISFIITEEIPGQWQAAEIKNRGLKTMLDINPGTRIFRQIDSFLSENYYHAPVKSVDTLLREEKSFTAAGFIHEKINHLHKGAAGETSDRSNFVLGWDNKEKIKLLTAELQTLKKNAALHERNIS